MSLRVAFDLDGVLADFDSAFDAIARRHLGPGRSPGARGPGPEDGDAKAADPEEIALHPPSARHLDRVWREIAETENFWASLAPLDREAVPRIQALVERYRWEVFFVTQRPSTAGESVQRQTQRWLARQGFELPSVLVLKGSRGKVAESLHLDFLVDDSPRNCVDLLAESHARPILVTRHAEGATTANARRLGIQVVQSIAEALHLLQGQEHVREEPSLFGRLAKLFGD